MAGRLQPVTERADTVALAEVADGVVVGLSQLGECLNLAANAGEKAEALVAMKSSLAPGGILSDWHLRYSKPRKRSKLSPVAQWSSEGTVGRVSHPNPHVARGGW